MQQQALAEQAAQALPILEPLYTQQREELIQRMLSVYRSGKADHLALLTLVAELSAMDQTIELLKARKRQLKLRG